MKTVILSLMLAVAGPSFAQTSPFNPGEVAWGAQPIPVSRPSSEPLPAHEAFLTQAQIDASGQVSVQLTSQPGYYIYRQSLGLEGKDVALGDITAPKGKQVHDENFGLTEVFEGTTTLTSPALYKQANRAQVTIKLQGCKEKSVCYPPMTRTFDLDMPASVPWAPTTPATTPNPNASIQLDEHGHPVPDKAEDQRLATVLGEQPAIVALALFLGLGVLLGLTPCVLPMVPIVLGLVAGTQVRTARTAALAGTYVVSHALVFAGLGMVAAWVGVGVAAVFQSAWAVIPLALALAGLGVAMLFGVQVQMPSWVQAWASQHGQGGSLGGAAGMGALSSLIIGPCVAPPLAGIILYLAHEGNPWLGAGALFCLGLGMGMPMMAAALGFKRLLPQAGKLGRWVIVGMGVVFIALAAWLAGRVVPSWTVGVAVAALMAGLAWQSWRKQKTASQAGGQRKVPTWAAYGLMGALVMGWALNPPAAAPESAFDTTVAAQDLETVLAQAQAKGETVVVDVYADWCTACLDMERNTFAAPRVLAELEGEGVRAVKVDITQNSEADQALLKRFGLVGPPATLFFRGNEEQRHLRLIGVEAQDPFLTRLHTAQCQAPAPDHMVC